MADIGRGLDLNTLLRQAVPFLAALIAAILFWFIYPLSPGKMLFSESSTEFEMVSAKWIEAWNSSLTKTESKGETQETHEGQEASYLLPSDTRELVDEDLQGLDEWTTTLAINELYARYGLVFGVADIDDYFAKQPWYVPDPSIVAEDISFTDVERHNLDVLVAYAKANGWR